MNERIELFNEWTENTSTEQIKKICILIENIY